MEYHNDLPTWLDGERKPLIPGSVHTRTIQPLLSNEGEDTDEEDLQIGSRTANSKESDYTKLGRIIFVMRYHKKREELMVRLVQIEGLPVSQELYSPHSAYVDVQLKYTGSTDSSGNEVQPPRLDICLQQVYYFIISTQQMMSHSLEFQINTFDDQFRRYVSGMVEVNLCQELGEDILTGNEVVFVKEIQEPFTFSGEAHFEEDDFVSAVSDIDHDDVNNMNNLQKQSNENDDENDNEEFSDPKKSQSNTSSRATSHESLASNMSWEPEVSTDLLSISMNSLYYRCSSETDLTLNPLTQDKRSHSIGYLPTYEWTVTDIPLDDEYPQSDVEPVESPTAGTDYYKLYEDEQSDHDKQTDMEPPPKSFYTIVPVTPLHPKKNENSTAGLPDNHQAPSGNTLRKVAYKKHSKMARKQQLGRSLSINKRSQDHATPKVKRLERTSPLLDRSSSWPSLVPGGAL